MKNKNSEYGFTLIELLVVISIIGLLASVILVSLNGARVKGRDVKRLSDLKQIQTALELYYSDNNHYPITSCSGNPQSPAWNGFDSVNAWAGYGDCATVGGPVTSPNITASLSPYIKGASDPRLVPPADSGYLYRSDNGTDYKVMAYRTPENMNDFDPSTWDTGGHCGTVSNGQCSNVNTFGFWTTGGAGW